MATSTKKKAAPSYSLTLEHAGKTYKSKAETPGEAVSTLTRPDKIMSEGVLTISSPHGKRTLTLNPARLKRLFYNSKGVAEIHAKQLFFGLIK